METPPQAAECAQITEDATAGDGLGFLLLGKEAFLACPAEAIDRAVMERTAHAAVIPADFGWIRWYSATGA